MYTRKKLRRLAALLAMGLLLTASTLVGAEPAATPAPQPTPVTEITLDQAVNMALTNNPTGKIAVFEFEAAKGALTAARSYRWPTLSYNHKDAWTWHGEKYNDRYYGGDRNYTDDQFSNALTLNWTVWAGNKIESQVSQAKLALDSSQWGIASARQTPKYNATDT